MIRNLTLLVLGAAALAACNPNPTTVVANEAPDPMAAELANAPAIELPPAIAASKTYRCKDNSLLFIDWYSDGSARVKTEKGTPGTEVPAPKEGEKPTLVGSAETPNVTYSGKACHI